MLPHSLSGLPTYTVEILFILGIICHSGGLRLTRSRAPLGKYTTITGGLFVTLATSLFLLQVASDVSEAIFATLLVFFGLLLGLFWYGLPYAIKKQQGDTYL